jgi:hypothetical protein
LAIVATVLLWPRLPRSAVRALESADTYEVLSLDPRRPDSASPNDFHRYRVLGKTSVTDPSTRTRLNESLRKAVEPIYTSLPKCFNPRHGVRVTHAGQTTEFLICFECHQARLWQDGGPAGHWVTDGTPKALFDAVLRAAGVPLPPADE